MENLTPLLHVDALLVGFGVWPFPYSIEAQTRNVIHIERRQTKFPATKVLNAFQSQLWKFQYQNQQREENSQVQELISTGELGEHECRISLWLSRTSLANEDTYLHPGTEALNMKYCMIRVQWSPERKDFVFLMITTIEIEWLRNEKKDDMYEWTRVDSIKYDNISYLRTSSRVLLSFWVQIWWPLLSRQRPWSTCIVLETPAREQTRHISLSESLTANSFSLIYLRLA